MSKKRPASRACLKGALYASLFFIFSTPSYAQLSDLRLTLYVWESGECYEVDRKTQGQEFRVKRAGAECRELFPHRKTEWVPNEQKTNGNCFEVDQETSGQRFRLKVPAGECAPKELRLSWEDPHCFEVGRREDQTEFRRRLPPGRCLEEKETEYRWLSGTTPFNGKCLQVDKQTGGQKINVVVPSSRCRPEETSAMWMPDQDNPTRGRCYLVHATQGAQGYIQPTSDGECLDSAGKYRWLQESDYEGECYEATVDPEGEVVPRRAEIRHCRPQEVEKIFKRSSLWGGFCFERDRLTQGKSFQRRIPLRECRPERVMEYWLAPTDKKEEGRCFIIDRDKGPDGYLEQVRKEECVRDTGNLVFEFDAKTVSGECYELQKIGDREQRKRVNIDRCRPPEVIKRWLGDAKTLEGDCYELHKTQGAEGFLKRISKTECKPFYREDISYRFVIPDGAKEGRCFEVDKKTQGLSYARPVQDDYCRKRLVLPDI